MTKTACFSNLLTGSNELRKWKMKAGLYVPDDDFPSDVFWGRLEKQYRDKRYFEKIEWGKVEPRTKNKSKIQKAKEGLTFSTQGKLQLLVSDYGAPRTERYFWSRIACIMHGLWLSGVSKN